MTKNEKKTSPGIESALPNFLRRGVPGPPALHCHDIAQGPCRDRGTKFFFLRKLRDILGFHKTSTTEQPKEAVFGPTEIQGARKLFCRKIDPPICSLICWDFFADFGGGGGLQGTALDAVCAGPSSARGGSGRTCASALGGGLQIANRLRIVWCHPSQVTRQWHQVGESERVWPLVLGMGPLRGQVTALKRAGMQEPRGFVTRVLEVAHRWVYDGFGQPPAEAAQPHISRTWEPGINDTLLVGRDEGPPMASKRVDPIHMEGGGGSTTRATATRGTCH